MAHPVPSLASKGAPLRVLIVEDVEDDALLMIHELRRGGFEPFFERVETREALRAALRDREWDVLLADYRLPGFNGLDALGDLKATGLDIPFLLVSGTVEEETSIAAMRAGARDYLQKGKLGRLVAVVRREIHEAERRRQQQRLSTAIEQVAEIVFITDPDGTIRYVNPAFEKTTGYSPREALGQNPRILKSGKHDPDFYQEMWRTLTQGKTWIGHVTNKKKDGTLYEEETTISPVLDSAGKIVSYVAVKRDVTGEMESRRQLLQSQKIEVVGRLAGGVAHDFNNLLMVIGGYASLLLRRMPANDSNRHMAEEIRQTTERAAAITRQLLIFSRKQVVQAQRLDLNETLKEVDKMIRQMLGESIKVVKCGGKKLDPVMADPTQIQQVLMNLVVNAHDAMPVGGTLTLETRNVTLPSPEFPGIPEGEYVLLSIRDTGEGMTPEVQSHMFEPFFTTKDRNKGTGLGLAIVHGIVTTAGGHISVQSRVGEGSVFRILFPKAQGMPHGKRFPSRRRKTSGGTETILLVEDDEKVREVLSQLLQFHGYQVLEVADANQAIVICRGSIARVHLMLSDVVMPGMNGLDLAMMAIRERPDLKVVLMSGYSDSNIMDQIASRNDLVFLPKPIPDDQLLRKLREVLDGRGT